MQGLIGLTTAVLLATDPKDVILRYAPSQQASKLARVSVSDSVQPLSIVLVLLLLFLFFLS